MSEWKEYKLRDIAEMNKNSVGKTFNIDNIQYLDTGSITQNKIEGYQCYSIADAPSRAKRLVEENDIIYSTVRPIHKHFGYIEKVIPNLVVSTGFAVIKANPQYVHPKFLYYFLALEDTVILLDMIAEGSTSAYPSLRPDDIADLDISLPNLIEQRIIAETITSFDNKIDLLHRQNKTLEELAETLFRQWFVEEAEESWEEKGLDEIADFLNGLACQKFAKKANEIGLPVIKIKELRTGITEASDFATSDVPEKYIVNEGDTLFSWSGSLALVLWSGEQGVLNQHLFKVTSNKFPQWFYHLWIKYHLPYFIGVAEDKATTMGHIQRHHLTSALVVVPTKQKLSAMNEIISPLFEKTKSNSKQIQTLTQLRENLLPKLMSGEIKVN